jgi:hypothetical protein
MAATTSYGLHFGRASASWKSYQFYYQTDPALYPYLFGVGCNCRFNIEIFSIHGIVSPYFSPMDRVSSLGPLGTCPRVGARPQHPCGILLGLYTP